MLTVPNEGVWGDAVNTVSLPYSKLGTHRAPRFNSVQDQALEFLESAIEDYRGGCIGYNRREQYRAAVRFAYKRVLALHLEDALTPSELATCKECAE